MPALPVVPNVLRVQVYWSNGDDPFISTSLFFEYSGSAPSAASCLAFATSIYGSVVAILGPLVPNTTEILSVKVTDLSSMSGGVGEFGAGTDGSRTGGMLGGSIAFVTSYEISRRYRGGKPRNYWPFGTTTDLAEASRWTAGFVTGVHAAVTNLVAAISGLVQGGTTIGAHCSVSYYSGFTVVTNPLTHRSRNVPTLRAAPVVDAITGIVARLVVGSQRRRNV